MNDKAKEDISTHDARPQKQKQRKKAKPKPEPKEMCELG